MGIEGCEGVVEEVDCESCEGGEEVGCEGSEEVGCEGCAKEVGCEDYKRGVENCVEMVSW